MSGDSPPRLTNYLGQILEVIVRIRRYTEALDKTKVRALRDAPAEVRVS